MLAEEVMSACDENVSEASPHGSTSEMGLANPAVHFFRYINHLVPFVWLLTFKCISTEDCVTEISRPFVMPPSAASISCSNCNRIIILITSS